MAKQQKSAQGGLYALALARISIGLIFLWAFFDKLFGLGFATCRNAKTNAVTVACKQAWIHGGSPTASFLSHATKGPLASFYQSLSGHVLIDVLFMAGLLLIGKALTFGVGIRLATTFGSLLLLMMWSAALWPANNPLLDDHIVYVFVLFAIYGFNSQQKLGMGAWWAKQPIVKRFPILL